MEPITTAATVVSIAGGLRSLLGGGSKQPSVHQGWRVQGTLTRDGLVGTNTAWDQKGNTWGGAVESGDYYASIFREYLGDLDASLPVDVTVSAGEGYNAGLIRQLREGLQSIVGEVNRLAPPIQPILEPVLPDLFAPRTSPPSLFDPDPEADTPAAPTVPPTETRTSNPADVDSWWGDVLALFRAPPATNSPGANVTNPIVPPAFQQPPSVIIAGIPSSAATTAGTTAGTSSTPAAAKPINWTPIALLAIGAVIVIKGLS